jgi:nucleotide-binding universal stress UspA family protein
MNTANDEDMAARMRDRPRRNSVFKNILCAIDGSAHSNRALQLARDLTLLYRARLTLVHAVETDARAAAELRHFAEHEGLMQRESAPPFPSAGSASEVMAVPAMQARDGSAEAEASARVGEQLLEQACQQTQFEAGQADVQTTLVHGDPASGILELAKARDADAIVMGSRGLGTVKGLLLGSVSRRVSQEASCSCITVR